MTSRQKAKINKRLYDTPRKNLEMMARAGRKSVPDLKQELVPKIIEPQETIDKLRLSEGILILSILVNEEQNDSFKDHNVQSNAVKTPRKKHFVKNKLFKMHSSIPNDYANSLGPKSNMKSTKLCLFLRKNE